MPRARLCGQVEKKGVMTLGKGNNGGNKAMKIATMADATLFWPSGSLWPSGSHAPAWEQVQTLQRRES